MNNNLVNYKNRNANIELIRVVGCMLVIARHVFTAINFEAPGILKGLIYTFTINGVALFWLIMGFYLFNENYSFVKKIRATIVKIIVPSLILTFVSIYIFPWILGEMNFTESIFRNVGWRQILYFLFVSSDEIKIVDHLWYIRSYVEVIFWSPLLWYICKEGKKEGAVRRYLIVFEFASILFENIQYLLNQENIISTIIEINTPINDVILYVLLGYELSLWIKNEKNKVFSQYKAFIGYLFFVLGVAGLEFICKIRNLQREYYNHSGVSLFVVATVFLFIFLYRIKLNEKIRPLICFLGDKTFYMYLIHYCIARRLTSSEINRIDFGEKYGIFKFLICALGTFILTLVIVMVIKKIENIFSHWMRKDIKH